MLEPLKCNANLLNVDSESPSAGGSRRTIVMSLQTTVKKNNLITDTVQGQTCSVSRLIKVSLWGFSH